MASPVDMRMTAAPGSSSQTAFDRFLAEAARAILTLTAVAAMTAIPLVAHTIHPLFGILMVALLAGGCAFYAPQVSILAILFSFMFQNLIVSLLADGIRNDDEFDLIRAYNFLTLCVSWLVMAGCFLARWRYRPPGIDLFVKVTVVNLVVIGVYFLLGFVLYKTAAIINLRNIVTPLLLFQICLMVFSTRVARLGPALTAMGLLLILCGFLEFLFRDAWLLYTNSTTYWTLSFGPNWSTLAYDKMADQTGRVVTNLTDTFKIDFFNSPILSDFGIVMMRIFGPNMHAISFAYCLSFFSIFALYRGRLVQAGLFFVLLFLCNAKGPLIVFLLVGFSWTVFQLFGSRLALTLHALALAAYALAGVFIGRQIGDYHVLGLMSGFLEFFRNPIGHGIGAGGNLSPLFATINWEEAQAIGHTPFPVESSVGTLMYQLGFFAFLVLSTYVWMAWRLLKLARQTRNSLHAAASFALLAIVVNGLFQEEAYFAPLSLALYLALAGMILGAGIRSGLIESPHDREDHLIRRV